MQRSTNIGLVRTEQREVTLLFADLRGFTELAAALEIVPVVCELIAHVMDYLSEAIVEHNGYIIDYYGDGLAAMWNAPEDQPNHADQACQAGLAMLSALPEVTADWRGIIHSDLRLGVGVHSGMVQVGNAGSRSRVKYGPRGPAVHLASRVEAATKELHVPLVATKATVERLSADFAAHRICRARMLGFQEAVDLYAVCPNREPAADLDGWRIYDAALQDFEEGRLQEAGEKLALLDAPNSPVPRRFLGAQIQRGISREFGRRSTDRLAAADHCGVISFSTK